MADTQIMWAGLILGGGTDYDIDEITGWEDVGDVNDLSAPRVRGHGDHVGDLFSRSRIVTVSGRILDGENRDVLARALLGATPVSSDLGDLTIDLFGEALTARGRIVRRSVKVGRGYDLGDVPFALQWRCPDPLRYGPSQTATAGLPTSGGGLTYPLTYPLNYGALGATGQITLSNPGTASAPIRFAVRGALPEGFELSAAGQVITYPVAVPAGQVIEIDTDTGEVLVEGTASRRGNLSHADWMRVPAGESLTVQFTSLGGAYDPAAQLTATWAGAHW